MSEKQLRNTNILLYLILLVLIINLAIDIYPYYIAGRLLGGFSFGNLFPGIELKFP